MTKMKSKGTDVPIYRDAGFLFESVEEMKAALHQELDHHRAPELYIYSRYRNPTVVAVEEQIMQLEDCEWALLTQSGMSAIDLALSIFQRGDETGTWLFFSEIYGMTNTYIDKVLKYRRGIKAERFYPKDDRYDLAELEKVLDEVKPALVYFEAISNPMLIVADCEAIIKLARTRGDRVSFDLKGDSPFLSATTAVLS